MKRALATILLVLVLAVTGWAALVLLFTGPRDPGWFRPALAGVYALGSVAVLIWLRPFRRALGAWTIGLLGGITASHPCHGPQGTPVRHTAPGGGAHEEVTAVHVLHQSGPALVNVRK